MTKITDLGCDNFTRAEWNRYIVKHKLFTIAYQIVEAALSRTPLRQPLASWIPRGDIVQVGKKESRQVGGGEGWIIGDDVVIIENEGGDDGDLTEG